MAGDRVVKVSLTAQVSNYVAGMEQARKATQSTGTEAEKAQKKLEAQSQAMTSVGTGLVAMGALAAVGVGMAIKKFADFDAAMSEVQASTHESAANMGLLRDAAIDAGASTVFTASEAAGAINELAKAGVSTADVLNGGLSGALSLASAGGLAVADAASIAATALTQFKLKGSEIPHVADLLAAGAGKAQGSVDDLGQALKQGGLVAAQAGLSIDETTGTLAAFASAGLIGSDAGTSFKTMLLALEKPSKLAQDAMDQYGISVYDSNGKMFSMSKVAGILKDKLGTLTDEQRNSTLATIFGTDAVRSASVLYDQGAKGIQSWNDKVNDSGYAAETARLKLDNLNGDIEKLGGAFDTALIQSGGAANDSLRFLAQTVTSLIDVFNGAPPLVQEVALGLGIAAAGIGLVGGGALIAVPKIAAMKLALIELGGTARGLSLAAGAIGLAITAAAIAIGIFATQQADAKARLDSFQESLDASTGSFTKNTREAVINNLEKSGVAKTARLFGVSTKLMTDAILGNSSALGEVNAKLAEHREAAAKTGVTSSMLNKDFQNVENAITGTSGELGKAKAAWVEHQAAMDSNTEGVDSATVAYTGASDAAGVLLDDLVKLIGTINEANGVGQDAVTSNATYQKSLADLTDYVKQAQAGVDGYSLGVDANTVAGSANLAMLANLAAQSEDAAAKQFALDGNTQGYKATLESSHQAIIDNAIALGASADEAKAIADNIAAIPDEKQIKVIAETAAAAAMIQRFKDLVATIPGAVAVGPGVTINPYVKSANGNMVAYANGGFGSGVYKGRPGGIHKFAEPETGWEAYISGKPGMEKRNQGIALDALSRLGYTTPAQYAAPNNGGGSSSVSHVTNNNTFTAPAIETQDALTYATVMGREFGRQVAG